MGFMNKHILIIIALLLIVAAALCFFTLYEKPAEQDFIRIHIRANSNSELDQAIKHRVKDSIIDFLTPLLAETNSKQEAYAVINTNLSGITARACGILKSSNIPYSASAKLCQEEFPSRAYGDVVLEKGIYDSLIITLGEGQGDNWWCVAFPPLCFVADADVRYKSKILEIIHNAKKK
jgi:stage II sporulation protein R